MEVLRRRCHAAPARTITRTSTRRTALFVRRGALAALLVSCSLMCVTAILRGQAPASTDEVKAAYLFNFAKFVEWPGGESAAAGPLLLGVMGSDGVADALARIVRGKAIGGRALEVRRATSADNLARFHLLFVGTSQQPNLGEFLRRVDGSGVLTVSDIESFCRLGGTIGLVLEENRVKFEINLEPAERARLKVSSKLLNLARTVYPARAGAVR
jgi:hypothetical protein